MKKRNLFLLLIMSLILIMPKGAKAFTINAAGICNVADGQQANGTSTQICYTGVKREITFITSNESPSQKYFCLEEDKDLDSATYGDTPTTYSNSGYACAVYALLNDGTLTIDQLRTAIGGNSGTLNFSVTPDDTTHYTLSATQNTAQEVYVKIQQKIWDSSISASTNCASSVPYVQPKGSAVPSISSNLTATELTKDDPSDEYLYSKVTVTKNSAVPSYKLELTNEPANTKVAIDKAGATLITNLNAVTVSEFYILIPATATNINVNVKASYTYTEKKVTNVTINQYTTSHTANQSLGKLSATTVDTSKTTSGQIRIESNPTIDFKICKVNKANPSIKIPGVQFKIKPSGSEEFTLTTGSDGCAIKKNVSRDTYTITEVSAPAGYVKMANGTANCTTTAYGTACEYTAENTPITLKVKKLDTSNKPLKDAKMKILKADGTEAIPQWTSVLEDKIIDFKDMPFGKYTLVEEEAPNGYVISTSVEFEIYEDHYVVNNETKQYTADATVTVTMIDEPTKVSILKVDKTTGKPLSGAVLVIEDADGNRVTEEWTTDGTAKVFTNLSFGTYYLVEISAPDGYVATSERTEFTISQTSADEEVIIENEEVPSTASSKSALLISFAMLDVAIGIAILLYVKKRQAFE